jgi:O-antigen ligase
MYGDGHHINQRLLEWQAASNALAGNPFLGVGLGNYQSEIGYYYRSLPKLNTMEPDSQNGYLITAATIGIVGLATFFWVLLHFFKSVIRSLNIVGAPFLKGLTLGLLGGLVGFSLNNLFSPVIYQSAVVVFVLVLSLIRVVESISAQNTTVDSR